METEGGAGGSRRSAVERVELPRTFPRVVSLFGGMGDQYARNTTSDGPRLVAAGFDASDGHKDAAVWTSLDGVAWSRVPHDESLFGGVSDQFIESGGRGLVAVGADASGGDGDVAVWVTAGGD